MCTVLNDWTVTSLDYDSITGTDNLRRLNYRFNATRSELITRRRKIRAVHRAHVELQRCILRLVRFPVHERRFEISVCAICQPRDAEIMLRVPRGNNEETTRNIRFVYILSIVYALVQLECVYRSMARGRNASPIAGQLTISSYLLGCSESHFIF